MQYDLFTGLKEDRVYGQGLKIIAPWNKMFIYSHEFKKTAPSWRCSAPTV